MTDKDEMKDQLQKMIEEFRGRIEESEKLQKKLDGFERNVSILFEDDGNFHFSISECDVGDIKEGDYKKSEIVIKTDTETFNALIEKEMKPMEAYARKKVKIDASFLDMLKIKDMF
ncbi:MAG: SCP2 sterol-binding domain-containing protein [Thermoplasmata archaeon]